jgi:tetratricopeptide (TPR) repeat protein
MVRSSAAAAATAPAQSWSSQHQLAAFEKAIKLFHGRKFGDARGEFDKAAQGPERDVAQRARLHISMCDSRLQKEAPPPLGSAEDYYNYGVALINVRKLAEARANLERGLQISPDADHLHFAMALAKALSGDYHGAHENLRRAIEIEPRNRLLARQDTDFAPLCHQPPLDSLLYPEKKAW